MPQKSDTLTLIGLDEQHYVYLSAINYHGHGAYSCELQVRSNGFSCKKTFSFDNDEYFLAKLRELILNKGGEAELMDLQSDNYLKIQAFETNSLLITGLIIEESPFSQSLEFAFPTGYDMLERFASDIARLVQMHV